ncbi:uncharacterized protein LOC135832315 isoform X2 [Planococcus citri]|uniref:uncharacterized protein LOC135832315 isoform X2 n=1 Tax=Planococcus citri TaxID=170843 RepID=UPI0031F8D29B
MAEFYFNQSKPDRRAMKNNSNVTGMSTNKNGEFKVPFPPRSVTQTLCSNSRQPQQNQEGSALKCLQPIAEKFEVFDKLGIVPQDVVEKMTSEFCQKLNAVCMENLAQLIRQPNQNSAPSVINDNGSVLHSIISQAHVGQPSVRSCICQGSTCGSEIGYSVPKGIIVKEPPPALGPIPERPERSKQKAAPVLPPNDENNDSIVSFFKKNQSQNTKVGRKKFAPSVVTTNAVEKTASNARTSRINTLPRSQSATRPKGNAARSTEQRTRSVVPNYSEATTDDSELMNSALKSKVAVVINHVSEAKLTKNNVRNKRQADSSVEPKKNKRVKNSSKQDDDINANDNSKTKRVSKKQSETKENQPVASVQAEANEDRNICGYDQTDQEMFGDFSTIINDTIHMRDSPNNVLKNVTKVSTNKNDQPSHIFSPFSNIRSTSGVSAISTPLSKTLPKTLINKRLKKPDVASEFKSAKPRPVKRIVQNDVVRLDASQESEYGTSDFSDAEDVSDES